MTQAMTQAEKNKLAARLRIAMAGRALNVVAVQYGISTTSLWRATHGAFADRPQGRLLDAINSIIKGDK